MSVCAYECVQKPLKAVGSFIGSVGRSDMPAKSRLVLRPVTGTMPGPFAPHCVYSLSLSLSLYLSVGPGVITMCSCCCSCCCKGRAKGKGVCIFTPAYPPCVHKWNIFLLFPRLLVVVICIMLLLFRFCFFFFFFFGRSLHTTFKNCFKYKCSTILHLSLVLFF